MSDKQKRILWPTLVTGLMLLSAMAFVAGRPRGVMGNKPNTTTPTVAPVSSAPVTLPEQSTEQDVQGLVIALRPNGFSPAEIEVTDGRYLFIVQNRVGVRDISFQLDREGGGKLHEVHDQKLQWKKEFDLHPGTYVLSVVDHPKWRCVITVKSH